MMSRDNGSSWCTHGVHIVTEIKEYDVRAYGHGIVTLKKKHGGWVIGHEDDAWPLGQVDIVIAQTTLYLYK